MSSLSPELRTELRRVVLGARRVAEEGARGALESLSVPPKDPATSLKVADRKLRNALRAHARHLGDSLDRSGVQAIDHLAGECAYEHWHRMLFARFLAENGLLLHPEGAAVSLEEARELAREEKPPVDPWTLASRWAARMLPGIFRPDDPVLAFELAPEKRIALEKLLAGLPAEVFAADDSLGWVYQFWQEEKKDDVNRSEVKIGADELPAVTQLFTEPYMVKFLLHNTLGAWWVGRHGGKPPVEMEYLRFLDDGRPAAGTFPEWSNRAAGLKCLDPCCGSGHFLVEMLRILVAFRMQEEKLSVGDAVEAVLRDNLFGLEIDPRCTQIAAFAVALEAWKLAGKHRPIPADGLHIACSGIAPRAKKAEWLRLAGDDERLRAGLDRLYDLFQDAPTLGSLIDPGREEAGPFAEAGWDELRPLLAEALANEKNAGEERRELGVAASGIAAAAELLASRYTLVATNVPYLARNKHDSVLRDFSDRFYPEAKADLATVFLERVRAANSPGGSVALVTPHTWLFLGNYRRLRQRLLNEARWDVLARLGEGGFQSSAAAGAFVVLSILSRRTPLEGWDFPCWDASSATSPTAKAVELRNGIPRLLNQHAQLAAPDARVSLGEGGSSEFLLSRIAGGFAGIQTGDFPQFGRLFWELPLPRKGWTFQQTTVEETIDFGGLHNVLFWEEGRGKLLKFVEARLGVSGVGAWLRGHEAWGKMGVCVSSMRELPVARYLGDLFDNNAAVVVPEKPADLPAIWAFCSSPEFSREVRKIDQTIKVTNATLVKVPFDRHRWEGAARLKYPEGLPAPSSQDPTQWIFRGEVVPSTVPLQVAVSRLVGYKWPNQISDALDGHCDKDGIVCVPSVCGELPAGERLRALLSTAHGRRWSPACEAQLLAAADFAGRSLDDWLREVFFEQHCRFFHNRPFVWHVWDGRKKDGFSALVDYHKLNRKGLERLTFTILGDWIAQMKAAEKQGEATAEARLAAALRLKERLEAILEGEEPYDIFVRWKTLAEQPIGWEPDLNDGVRMNIRPFVEAGVLRKTPKIKWDKDRGKNPPGSPWGEERLNDLHLSLAEKRRAREKAGKR